MDKFLAAFESKSQNQKILIALGLVVFVLVLMGISFLLTTPQTSNTNNVKNSGNTNVDQGSSSNSNSSSGNYLPSSSSLQNRNQANIPEGWQTSQYSDYQISYPSSFTPQLGSISGGGVSLSLVQKPSTFPAPEINMEMQVYDAKDVPLQRISQGFTELGYTKSVIKIGEIDAQKFSGSIVATTSASLHTSVVIFENNGRTFKIQLDYIAEKQDNQIEGIFNKIVATFSLISPQ